MTEHHITGTDYRARQVLGENLIKLIEEDVERHARACEAVQRWGHLVDVWLSVDDAVNIVSAVIKAWSPINSDEAIRDRVVSEERVHMHQRKVVVF
jgi:hypothetical protein